MKLLQEFRREDRDISDLFFRSRVSDSKRNRGNFAIIIILHSIKRSEIDGNFQTHPSF